MEDPHWWCGPFPADRHAGAHTFSHMGRQTADWEKLLLPFFLHPAGTKEQGAFEDDTSFVVQGALPRSCLGEPDLQCLGDAGQLSHLQTARHRSTPSSPAEKQQLNL